MSSDLPLNEESSTLLVDLLRGVADPFGAEYRGAVIDVRNARYQLRRRIFDLIDGNLGDQDLSPKKIAAHSRISLSYL